MSKVVFGTGLGIAFVVANLIILGAVEPVASKTGEAIFVLSTDCPVVARYSPRMNALYETFASKGISFRAIFPNDLESREMVSRYREERSFKFPCALDLGATQAKKYGADVLPTIIVLDSKGKMVYKGAIDDHKDPSLVRKRYAEDALKAVVAGRKPLMAFVQPFGCVLMPSAAPPSTEAVNYAEHIAPILNKRCVGCHRPGEVAPFSLIGYENAHKWAPMIAQVTSAKRMPPWKAAKGYGEFLDENTLSESDIETVSRWEKAGAPRGDAGKEPKPPSFSGEWPFGEPDHILKPSKPFNIEADGADVYRHFVLKTNFPDTKYVQAMAVRPGNPRVVHHVIAFVDEKGVSHRLDGRNKDGQDGYDTFGGPGFSPDGSFGGWAPGLQTQRVSKGMGFELKPGATIVMQVHYHKDGKPETDQTRLGLYFAKEPVDKVMSLAWLANPFFRLAPGAKNQRVTMSYPVPEDATLYSVMPHMHLLGKSMKAEVEKPDGTKIPLIFVDKWDFNWQMNYMLKEPIKVPAGSKVNVEAFYDNSEDNKNNPSRPPKPVTWGEQTTDEMFLLIASYTLDHARAPKSRRVGFGGG